MTTDTRREPIHRKFWFHLLLVLLISALLYLLFFSLLGWITNHGEQTKVPNVTGKPISVAMAELKRAGFEVDVDSTYEPDQKPLTVLQQLPDVGDVVKTGRTLFLIVNKAEPPMTPMPNLNSLSYRSALLILKSNKLILDDTVHVPNYVTFVLGQQINGQDVRPGTMIPQGSKVVLVLGDGGVNQAMDIPEDVIGLDLASGLDFLSGALPGVLLVAVNDDPGGPAANAADSAAMQIYKLSIPPKDENGRPHKILPNNSLDVYYKRKENVTPEELDEGRNGANSGAMLNEPAQPATTE